MSTPIKWVFWMLLALFVVFFIGYTASLQHNAVRTTSEVDVLAENMRIGLIRSEVKESNDGYAYIDKEEVVANLIAYVSSVQKEHGYDIHLQYAFLDKSGNITDDEQAIRGLQFIVQYVNDEGEVKATAERRLEFHALEND